VVAERHHRVDVRRGTTSRPVPTKESSMAAASSPLERELRRMEVIVRREQLRLVGRVAPRATERRRWADVPRRQSPTTAAR
jgi:hypothetical protein